MDLSRIEGGVVPVVVWVMGIRISDNSNSLSEENRTVVVFKTIGDIFKIAAETEVDFKAATEADSRATGEIGVGFRAIRVALVATAEVFEVEEETCEEEVAEGDQVTMMNSGLHYLQTDYNHENFSRTVCVQAY
jgi:hypothetical protein